MLSLVLVCSFTILYDPAWSCIVLVMLSLETILYVVCCGPRLGLKWKTVAVISLNKLGLSCAKLNTA